MVSREDRQLSGLSGVILDLDVVIAESVPQWYGLSKTDRLDTGLSLQPHRELSEESADLGPVLNLSGGNRDARREDLFRVEPGIHRAQGLE
jgi:hypothetical protein